MSEFPNLVIIIYKKLLKKNFYFCIFNKVKIIYPENYSGKLKLHWC